MDLLSQHHGHFFDVGQKITFIVHHGRLAGSEISSFEATLANGCVVQMRELENLVYIALEFLYTGTDVQIASKVVISDVQIVIPTK